MNSYTIGAKYLRLAIFSFFIFCGKTANASEMRPSLWPAGGAAISAVSAIIRYAKPPVSPLGIALDAACAVANGYEAVGFRQNSFSAIFDFGCLTGLGLQFSRLVPALTWGINDPLEAVRTMFSLANICIIGYRLSQYPNNNKKPDSNFRQSI